MFLKPFLLRPRLIGSFVLAALIGFLLPDGFALWQKALLSWCAGTVTYMALISWTMSRSSQDALRTSASALDDSAWIILLIGMVATAASFGGIAALLFGTPSPGGSKLPDALLAGGTMICSWAFMQVIFTVHYAHIYYGDDENGSARGGLKFSGDDEPDFWDFIYFTTSIGATAQTSDTAVVTRRMRRIVAAQAVYSFLFNTAVLAMAINIAAGLVGH
ncbi:DUF1345 domain-containing protein [Lichenihabitans sp. Uapishka_5]|uniref:DUF1345 domain-containing protein n=1 Tax=Lichenihabitans sp. Uapishka_5 TaxID=3037302 RepID=UPI0029E7D08C|nr:DUF1345 domain-containing protein [Lichenihabitans sp. Uapishka_5]MDX7953042.1 DUF1345 domain-containing protein [Lichenihabitans sp. Uapishka_5]